MAWFIEKHGDNVGIVGTSADYPDLEAEHTMSIASHEPGYGFHLHFPIDEEDERLARRLIRNARRSKERSFTWRRVNV